MNSSPVHNKRKESVQKTRKLKSAQLSPPELYALMASGFEPIGIVMGVAAISMGARGIGRSIQGVFRKGEMTAVSQTSLEARKLALARAEAKAIELGADLFIASHWEVRDAAEIVEITCTGTACKKVGAMKSMPIAAATS